MAGSVNKVILVGNLGADPEGRDLNNGRVVNLRVATSETWKDKASGERKERTEWHQVVIYNENLGKIAEQYLSKGSKVYLEGALQTRKYQKDGEDRYVTEVVLQAFRGELTILSGNEGGGRGGNRDDDRGGRGGGRDDRGGRSGGGRGDDRGGGRSGGRSDDRGGRGSSGGGRSGGGRGNYDLDDDIPF